MKKEIILDNGVLIINDKKLIYEANDEYYSFEIDISEIIDNKE